MKKLFIPVFALCVLSSAAFGDTKKSFKRGFGENTLYYVEDLQALLPGSSWYYDWGNEPSAQVADYVGSDKGIEFIPQAWSSYDENKLRAYYKAHPQDRYLLGFNEPNFPDQAAMLPAEAAEKWHSLEALANELGLKLVGPAMNYAGAPLKDGKVWDPFEWMDAFIVAYKEKYGTEPHYDYTAVHAYMDRAANMMDFVDKFYERYGKQVWLTEFCAWEDANLTADKQQEYMIDKLKALETSDHVYRYAWFKARNANKYPFYNLLYYPTKTITKGTLTELGFAYVHMSTFNKDKYYAVGEPIPANDFIDCNMLGKLQESADPRARLLDKTELLLNKNSQSVSYQIDVPADGTYQLVLRYARTADDFTARVNILDGNGTTLANRVTLEPTAGATNYVAKAISVSLKAGKQTITVKRASAAPIALSMVKLVSTANPADDDMQTLTGEEIVKPGTNDDTGGDTPTTPGENESFDKEVTVTDDAFKFDANDKYYAIYLDGKTQKANISDDRFVNLGDNGTSQNSYLWEGTFNYGDAAGKNSFGVEGEYMAIVSADKGWSGMGYNINSAKGDCNLSCINDDYKLHIALKAEHNHPVNFYITDGSGHVANLIFGQYDIEGKDPVANFKRDGKWHNIDIPMSYLHRKFGIDFRGDTDYDGNLLCATVGSASGVKVDFDAVFFYGPKDSKPNTNTIEGLSRNDVTVSDSRFQFSDDERYYIVTLDASTKARNLSESQIVDCGPNGTSQNLYPWDGTCTANSNGDSNSFGEAEPYMSWTETDKGWFGLGYNVAGSTQPLNLSGINDDYFLHFAVKTTDKEPILFSVTDGHGRSGNIVLGKEVYDNHKPLADFPRDGKWHNIEVPVHLLNTNDGVNFTRTTNFTGNIFSILMGGPKGRTIDYDAVFFHGPKTAPAYATEKVTHKDITVKKTDEAPFKFSDSDTYYIITLDDDTKKENIANDQIHDIGPNEQTRFLYPWGDTVISDAAIGTNSFGVETGYSAWETAPGTTWSGLGFFIAQHGLTDLSGIDKDYALHFAVKSTTTQAIDFVVTDGNDKAAHIVLGTEKYGDNAPVADFTRDNTWHNVDVPMTWLIEKGLDFRTAKAYTGNIFAVQCGTQGGLKVDYDAVFFHGPKPKTTGIETIANDTDADASRMPNAIFDLSGRQVNTMAQPGIYIMRTAERAKKIIKK